MEPGGVVLGGTFNSDGAGKPANRCAFPGATESFELVIPGLAQGEGHFGLHALGVSGRACHDSADDVLADDNVAVDVGQRMENAEVRCVAPPCAVESRGRFLGDFVANIGPAFESRRDLSA